MNLRRHQFQKNPGVTVRPLLLYYFVTLLFITSATGSFVAPCSGLLRMTQKKSNKRQNGFTLIEVLIGLFVLSLSVITIYSLFQISLKVIWESKAKIIATQLANQKIEMARNLPYNSVGTVDGIPAGSIPQIENVTRNDIPFVVATTIQYIDDPFDGVASGTPEDILPIDYKKVRVQVSWSGRFGAQSLVFMTNISPKEIESIGGGGTLKIIVFNAQNQAVPQAQIHLQNTSVNPIINLFTQTDNYGVLMLPGAPASIEGYHVEITKAEDAGGKYSTDQTYLATSELPSPNKPPLTVNEGRLTSISFSIDHVVNLNTIVKNQNGIGLAYVDVKIRNGKIIGYTGAGAPVYSYDEVKTTDVNGHIHLTDLECGSYYFSLPGNEPYNISGTNPLQPLDILPGGAVNMNLTLSPKEDNSLLVIATDVNGNPLADVAIRIFDEALTLDQTATTSDAGQIYFSPWAKATTTLEAVKTGFDNYSDTFLIDGYRTETVIMTTP
jgi:prepilin-type N-terminal cleavage/methylation domain-containing protein